MKECCRMFQQMQDSDDEERVGGTPAKSRREQPRGMFGRILGENCDNRSCDSFVVSLTLCIYCVLQVSYHSIMRSLILCMSSSMQRKLAASVWGFRLHVWSKQSVGLHAVWGFQLTEISWQDKNHWKGLWNRATSDNKDGGLSGQLLTRIVLCF